MAVAVVAPGLLKSTDQELHSLGQLVCATQQELNGGCLSCGGSERTEGVCFMLMLSVEVKALKLRAAAG